MRPDKCAKGHPNVDVNRTSSGRCKVCRNLYQQKLYAKQKQAYESGRITRTREQEIADLIEEQRKDGNYVWDENIIHPDKFDWGWRYVEERMARE